MSEPPQVVAALRRIQEAIEILQSYSWYARTWRSGLQSEMVNIELRAPERVDVMR